MRLSPIAPVTVPVRRPAALRSKGFCVSWFLLSVAGIAVIMRQTHRRCGLRLRTRVAERFADTRDPSCLRIVVDEARLEAVAQQLIRFARAQRRQCLERG